MNTLIPIERVRKNIPLSVKPNHIIFLTSEKKRLIPLIVDESRIIPLTIDKSRLIPMCDDNFMIK